MYKRSMNMFKNLWKKIKSSLRQEPSSIKEGGYQPCQDDCCCTTPTGGSSAQKPEYSETIGDVVYVTKENALRLIRDKKNTPPTPELKEAVKSTMFDSLAGSGYDNQKEELTEGLSSEEISKLIGSKKDSQVITDNADEKEKFMKETGAQTRPSKEALVKTKEEIKDKIPSQQAARSKAIKKKKASATAAKKRKNK